MVTRGGRRVSVAGCCGWARTHRSRPRAGGLVALFVRGDFEGEGGLAVWAVEGGWGFRGCGRGQSSVERGGEGGVGQGAGAFEVEAIDGVDVAGERRCEEWVVGCGFGGELIFELVIQLVLELVFKLVFKLTFKLIFKTVFKLAFESVVELAFELFPALICQVVHRVIMGRQPGRIESIGVARDGVGTGVRIRRIWLELEGGGNSNGATWRCTSGGRAACGGLRACGARRSVVLEERSGGEAERVGICGVSEKGGQGVEGRLLPGVGLDRAEVLEPGGNVWAGEEAEEREDIGGGAGRCGEKLLEVFAGVEVAGEERLIRLVECG